MVSWDPCLLMTRIAKPPQSLTFSSHYGSTPKIFKKMALVIGEILVVKCLEDILIEENSSRKLAFLLC